LLWESLEKTLSDDESELLERHMAECQKCQEVRATIMAIAESKKADSHFVSGLDSDTFDDAVFRKIRARESELRFKREDQGYMVRLYISVGLAAAIVAFMVLSLGDLDRYVMPSKLHSYRPGKVEKKRDTLHITLKSEETEPAPETPAPKISEPKIGADGQVMEIMPPPTVAKIPDTVEERVIVEAEEGTRDLFRTERSLSDKDQDSGLTMADAEPPGEKKGAMPEHREKLRPPASDYMTMRLESGKGQTPGDFSILSKPVTNPAPDSVVINSIYLSDESIPIASQQMRAFLPEVVVDSGIIQTTETPRSVLVTVDKMPVPVKIIPPDYPVWARKNGISGVVWIKARVDKEGNVKSAEVLSSSMPGYGFEEASLDAATQYKYLPAEAGGYKIEISVIYPVNFIFKE
jgi:TonB family protein